MIDHNIDLAVTNSWLEYVKDATVLGVSKSQRLDLIHFRQHVSEALNRWYTMRGKKRGRPGSTPPSQPRTNAEKSRFWMYMKQERWSRSCVTVQVAVVQLSTPDVGRREEERGEEVEEDGFLYVPHHHHIKSFPNQNPMPLILHSILCYLILNTCTKSFTMPHTYRKYPSNILSRFLTQYPLLPDNVPSHVGRTGHVL
ncbi:hypothetical protein J6590_038235 [Homalodisca vitripennis]|nr:hypothetical protein J6590_038235 [Homalodisca vitripennis]